MGKTPRKPRKRLSPVERQQVAAARMMGLSQKQIAEKVGCSISTVTHAPANHPEIRTMMRRLAESAWPKIQAGYMAAIEGIIADHAAAGKAGDVATRQKLRAELAKFVALADGTIKAEQDSESQASYTLVELLTMQHRLVIAQQAEGGALESAR